MIALAAETGRQIDVLRGSKLDTHLRSTIVKTKEGGYWISTVAIPNGTAETMIFEVYKQDRIVPGPRGMHTIDRRGGSLRPMDTLGQFDRYDRVTEAIRGHKRAVYAARRVLTGKTYTQRDNNRGLSVDESFKVLMEEVADRPSLQRSQVPECLLFDFDKARGVRTEDLSFQEGMRRAVNRPNLERSKVPDHLRSYYDRLRSNS